MINVNNNMIVLILASSGSFLAGYITHLFWYKFTHRENFTKDDLKQILVMIVVVVWVVVTFITIVNGTPSAAIPVHAIMTAVVGWFWNDGVVKISIGKNNEPTSSAT